MNDRHSADHDAHAGRLRIWREAAEKGIESGIDWPMIARALFKELDAITEDRDMFRGLYYDGIRRDLPPPPPGVPQNPVNGATHPCPTPGYAGRHTAVGAGAMSPPYVCHGCSTWFVLPDESSTVIASEVTQ